jgi:hypothetical protein
MFLYLSSDYLEESESLPLNLDDDMVGATVKTDNSSNKPLE